MNKILNSLLLVLLASAMAIPLFVSAAGLIPEADNSMAGSLGKDRFQTAGVESMLNTVANYVVGMLVIVAIFYILWAGYTFITSSGETEKVNAARQRIMYAAIGVVIALLAKGIVALVLSLTNPGEGI